MGFSSVLRVAALTAALIAPLAAQGPAQRPAPQGGGGGRGPQPTGPAAPGRVVGVTAFSHSVTDVDRAVQYYRDVFGFEVVEQPSSPVPDAAWQQLTNTEGYRYRSASMRLPRAGFVLRLMEFSGGDRRPGKPRQTDPGQTNLLLRVRDIDAAFAAVTTAGAEIVSLGGKPVSGGNGAFAALFSRDPDGYVIETVRAGQMPLPEPGEGNAWLGVIAMTTDDTNRKLGFYRDLLGFEMATGNWGGPQFIMDMVGAGSGEFRQSNTTAGIPGTRDRLEFYEYRNIPAKTSFRPRLQDPPAGMVSLVVANLDEMARLARAAAVPIVTVGGEPVRTGNSRRLVVQDPDGVYIELIQQ